jgi:hypothetical protein
MHMGLRAWGCAVGLALAAMACGDSSSPSGVPLSEADATTICEAACSRADACDQLAPKNITVATCTPSCAAALVKDSKSNDCKYTSAQVDACAVSYETYSCTSLADTNDEGPAACSIGCP